MEADILICPGDFSDKACRDSLRVAWEKSHEVAKALRAHKLIATTGNHDVDSRNLYNAYDPIEELKSLSPQFPVADNAMASNYWAYHYHVCTYPDVSIVNVNSSAYHMKAGNEIEHGRVADTTLRRIQSELESLSDSSLKVLLCHHNPHTHSELGLGEDDGIIGGQHLLDLLAASTYEAWLVIHGHKHHPKLTYAAGASSAPVVFSAGSVSSTLYPALRAETGNQFYIIEIPLDEIPVSGLVGTFRSWDWHMHYGWQEADNTKGLPAFGGFGHRESPSRLAARITKWLQGRRAVHASDTELLKRFSELRYVIPSDLRQLNRCLQSRGFSLEFNSSGTVNQVVQYVAR
jgi:predicted phosphodiesterase